MWHQQNIPKGLFPPFVQVLPKRFKNIAQNSLLYPFLIAPMTGLVRWVSLRKIAPARPCSQYPNYAVQYFSIVEMPIMGPRPKRPWEAPWRPRLGGLPSTIFQTPPAWRAIGSIPYRPLVGYGARRSCSLSLAASVFRLNSSRAFPTRMLRSFTMDSTPRTLLTLCST